MGLFSFVGKALKAVGKVAGIAGKIVPGLGLASGVIGKVAGIAGNILDAKRPMGTSSQKITAAARPGGYRFMRGNVPQGWGGMTWANASAPMMRASPVLPGGAIATFAGPVPASGGVPPASYGGKRGPVKRRKKPVRRGRVGKKRTRGRKLKFGSPAWRKKYLSKRRAR